MSPEKEIEIQKAIEDNVLVALNSKKPKEIKAAIEKAKLGMDYEKHVQSIRLNKLGAIVKVAGLYQPHNKEEIAKKIVPPRYEIIDTDIEVIPRATFEEIAESVRKNNEERVKAEGQAKEESQKAQRLQNQVDDLKDTQSAKDKTQLVAIAQQEYEQKRDY